MSFPCAMALVNGTARFDLVFEITEGPYIGQTIMLTGTKRCSCSTNACRGTESNSDPNLPFYLVIGCVGGIIALVIVVVVLYHCIMCRTLVTQRQADLEEE